MSLRKNTTLITSIGLISLMMACGPKKEKEPEADAAEKVEKDSLKDDDDWKGMDDFHMVMAEAFHPYKDSSNLEPAKAKAHNLVTAAENWASQPLPAKVNTEDIKRQLENLKAETVSFEGMVQSKDDKAIAEAITKLHDDFHALQEAWYGGGKEHHHH